MSAVLKAWNSAVESSALETMIACCGAQRWATAMVAARPFHEVLELSEAADRIWGTMQESDWLEAFACHPRIGERKAAHATAQSVAWSRQEQSSASAAKEGVLEDLASANAQYEERFGFTYIVCATGKSAEQMMAILQQRLENDRTTELREAAEQQRQILQIRLGKWLMQ